MKVTGFTSIPQQNKKQYMSQDKSQINFGGALWQFEIFGKFLPEGKDITKVNSLDIIKELRTLADIEQKIRSGEVKFLPSTDELLVSTYGDSKYLKRQLILQETKDGPVLKDIGQVFVNEDEMNPNSKMVMLSNSIIAFKKTTNIEINPQKDAIDENNKSLDWIITVLKAIKAKVMEKRAAETLDKVSTTPSPAPKPAASAAGKPGMQVKKPEILKLRVVIDNERTNSPDGLVPCIRRPGVNAYWYPEGSSKDEHAHFIIEFIKKGSTSVPESKYCKMEPDPDKYKMIKPFLEWFNINPEDYRLSTPIPAKA